MRRRSARHPSRPPGRRPCRTSARPACNNTHMALSFGVKVFANRQDGINYPATTRTPSIGGKADLPTICPPNRFTLPLLGAHGVSFYLPDADARVVVAEHEAAVPGSVGSEPAMSAVTAAATHTHHTAPHHTHTRRGRRQTAPPTTLHHITHTHTHTHKHTHGFVPHAHAETFGRFGQLLV